MEWKSQVSKKVKYITQKGNKKRDNGETTVLKYMYCFCPTAQYRYHRTVDIIDWCPSTLTVYIVSVYIVSSKIVVNKIAFSSMQTL